MVSALRARAGLRPALRPRPTVKRSRPRRARMLPGRATPDATAAFADASPADARNYANARGLTLSNVGIGTYLGEADDQTDRAVEAAVRVAAAAGVNVVDTAINYRAQRAERSVGRALAAMAAADGGPPREAVFVSTKNGYVTHDAEAPGGFWEQVKEHYTDRGIVKEGDISSGYHCMTVRFLEDQLDRSLANTGLECIDLLYLHNAVEGQFRDVERAAFMDALASVFEMYERKRRQGRIAFYGMATWECFRAEPGAAQHLSMADAAAAASDAAGGDEHGLAFVQMPFNLHYDEALLRRTQDVGGERMCALDAARRLGIGVFASAPLMQGRLLAPGVLPEFLGIASPAARALQFVRSAPGVSAALVGQKSAAHAAENMRVMGMPPVGADEFGRLVGELVSSPPRGRQDTA